MKRFPSLPAAVVLGLLALSSPVLAQSGPGAEDLRALRFYIQQDEAPAIEAEIRRLKTQFPGWAPPANLADLIQTQSGPSSEVADIYARLGRGDIEGMRRVVQRTRARYPSWQMPSDLARAIELAEAQVAFDRAVNGRDVSGATQIGAKTPALFRCDRINNAWNLAELQTSAGSPSRALATYRQIVSACTTVPDLVATIEKAEAVTSDSELIALIDVAKQRFRNHTATFDALSRRLLAGRGRGRVQPAAPAATVRAPTARPAAAPAPTPTAAAPVPAPSRELAPAVLSVATAPALGSLPRSGDGRVTATRSAAKSGAFRDCLARSARPRSLDLAYERAWCAYNMDRPLEALALFSASADAGLGGSVRRDARFGMALSLLKRSMTDDAARVAASTDLTTQQRTEVETIILDQRGVRAFENGDNQGAIDYFNALGDMQGGLRRDLAMMRGYAWLRLGNREQARAQFQQLHDALATAETRVALNATR